MVQIKISRGEKPGNFLLLSPRRTRESFLIMTFSCNVCNREFLNKNTRDIHKKSICLFNVSVKKSNGEEEMIDKVNGKFTCLCGTSVIRTDHFQKHWKECQIQG